VFLKHSGTSSFKFQGLGVPIGRGFAVCRQLLDQVPCFLVPFLQGVLVRLGLAEVGDPLLERRHLLGCQALDVDTLEAMVSDEASENGHLLHLNPLDPDQEVLVAEIQVGVGLRLTRSITDWLARLARSIADWLARSDAAGKFPAMRQSVTGNTTAGRPLWHYGHFRQGGRFRESVTDGAGWCQDLCAPDIR
jgi:hypothetical protein